MVAEAGSLKTFEAILPTLLPVLSFFPIVMPFQGGSYDSDESQPLYHSSFVAIDCLEATASIGHRISGLCIDVPIFEGGKSQVLPAYFRVG
jgi:hypothetical protein